MWTWPWDVHFGKFRWQLAPFTFPFLPSPPSLSPQLSKTALFYCCLGGGTGYFGIKVLSLFSGEKWWAWAVHWPPIVWNKEIFFLWRTNNNWPQTLKLSRKPLTTHLPVRPHGSWLGWPGIWMWNTRGWSPSWSSIHYAPPHSPPIHGAYTYSSVGVTYLITLGEGGLITVSAFFQKLLFLESENCCLLGIWKICGIKEPWLVLAIFKHLQETSSFSCERTGSFLGGYIGVRCSFCV